MTKKASRVYTLYSDGANIYSRSRDYSHGMWIITVRAVSIKQAYYFCGNKVAAEDNKGMGVVMVDCSDGPQARAWDWQDCSAPWWWTHDVHSPEDYGRYNVYTYGYYSEKLGRNKFWMYLYPDEKGKVNFVDKGGADSWHKDLVDVMVEAGYSVKTVEEQEVQ